jgi:uncharacterized protein
VKVSFAEITTRGFNKVIAETRISTEPGIVFIERPVAEVSLSLIDEHTATLDGRIKATIEMACSRCIQPVVHELQADYSYIFRLGEDSSFLKRELECTDEDCSTVYLQEPIIDLDEIIQEQWLLAVPVALVCRDNCKGLCYRCGALLDDGPCGCTDEDIDSPFAKLKSLKR